MNSLLEHPLVGRVGWTLLHFLWQGAAIALLLALLLPAVHRVKPAVRYTLACSALLLMAICPAVTFCHLDARSAPREVAAAPASPILGAPPAPASIDPAPSASLQSPAEPRTLRIADELAGAGDSSTTRIHPLGIWQPLSVAIWLLGVVLLSIRHSLALVHLRSLRRTAEPIVDPALQQMLARLRERLGIRRAVELLASARLHAPAVIGVLKPAIVFPISALSGLSSQQLSAVLAHELAHVRRWDFPVNLLQSVIETILFYHPAVWWVSHVARREREFCADDIAIAAGNDRVSYAKALTRLAELDQATLAVAVTGGSLLPRVKRIIGQPEPRRGGAFTMLAGFVTAGVFAVALMAPSTIAQDSKIVEVKAGESIQAAIDAAAEGTEIRVGEGEFKERVRITKKVTLHGRGWDKTRISLPPDDPNMRKSFEERIQAAKSPDEREALIEQSRLALDGPTLAVTDAKDVMIRGLRFMSLAKAEANAELPPVVIIRQAQVIFLICAFTGPANDGLHILDGSNVEVANCLVAGLQNEGITIRGARGADPKVVIRDSEIRNIYHYGMSFGRGCDRVSILRCRISGTMWHGIRYDNASPLIEGNFIYGHARSGIYASGRTRATVRGNVFFRNEMSGISCWFNNEDLIEQNTFADNQREALAVLGASKPKVRSNIFYANPVAIAQGEINDDASNARGSAILENNVFWKNGKNLPVKDQEALPEGSASILADPQFTDGDKGNFKLAGDSPVAKAKAGAADPLTLASPWAVVPEEAKHIPDAANRAANVSTKPGAASQPRVDIYQKRAQLYKAVESVVKDALQIDDAEKRKAAIEKIRSMVGSSDEREVAEGLVAYASIGPVSFDKTSFRQPLLEKLSSEDPFIRSQAIGALSGGAGSRDDLPRILERAKDPDPAVRGAVTWSLISLTKKDLTGAEGANWMEMFEGGNAETQREMIRGLWGVKTTTALQERLVTISREDRGLSSDTLYYALSTSPNKQASCVTRLIEYLADGDTINVAGRALWGLGYGVEPSEQARVAAALIKVYNAREDGNMRQKALAALQSYARAEHVPELEKIIAKPGIGESDMKQLERIVASAKQRQ